MNKEIMEKRKRYAIIDYRMDNLTRKSLLDEGFILIDSFKNNNVYNAINGHVDISLFYNGEIFVASKESYNYYYNALSMYNIDKKIISGNTYLNSKYPKNVRYNLCFSGKYSIGNFNYIDEKVIEVVEEYEKINVKQGYSNCSILAVDKKSFITSDSGIYNTLKSNGIDVLKISEGNISLFGMNYGFIGGASAVYGNKVYFFGNIKSHPDFKEILNFIDYRGKESIVLGDGILKDYGSMYIVD